MKKVLERYVNCEPDVRDMQQRLDDLEHEASKHALLDRYIDRQIGNLSIGYFSIPDEWRSITIVGYRITRPWNVAENDLKLSV